MKKQIAAALAAGQLPSLKIFAESEDMLVMTFDGDVTGAAQAICSVIQENKINFCDPTPGSDDDFRAKIDSNGGANVKTTVYFKRLDEKGYNKILDKLAADQKKTKKGKKDASTD